jgi:CheY-like chemotaxis protein
VLVVDDCETNQAVAAGLLRACDVDVVLADSGEAALSNASR